MNGTWELGGPAVFTMNEVAARSLPDARALRATRSAPKALLKLYAGDMIADRSAVLALGLSARDDTLS